MNTVMKDVIDGLKTIHENEDVSTLPEYIEKLQELIEEHNLTLDNVLEWWEEDPGEMAYLMKYGHVEQQEFGVSLAEKMKLDTPKED